MSRCNLMLGYVPKSVANGYSVILIGCLYTILQTILFADPVISQSIRQVNSENAFDQRTVFPWFDSGTQEVRPIKTPNRPKSRAGDRSSVPELRTSSSNNAGPSGQTSAGAASRFSDFFNVALWTVLGVLLAIIAAVLVWAFLRSESNQQKMGRRMLRKRTLVDSIEQLPFDTGDAQGDLLEIAHRAYQSGDLRKAIIYLFSHVLVTLDQAQLIRLRKGKTNRQYAQELNEQASLREYFIGVMHPFETVFFGDQEIDRKSFEPCWNGLQAFQNEIERRRQGGVH